MVHLSAVAVVVHQGDIEQIQTEDHIDQCFHGFASSMEIALIGHGYTNHRPANLSSHLMA